MQYVGLLCCALVFAFPLQGFAGTFVVSTPINDDVFLEQKASDGQYANVQAYLQNIIDRTIADLRLTQSSIDQSALIGLARACLGTGKAFTVTSDPLTRQVSSVCK